jgi:hypothetical protein
LGETDLLDIVTDESMGVGKNFAGLVRQNIGSCRKADGAMTRMEIQIALVACQQLVRLLAR